MLGPSLRRMPSVQNFGIRRKTSEKAGCREQLAAESLEEEKPGVISRELLEKREARAKMFAGERTKRMSPISMRPQIPTEPLSPSTKQPAPKLANLPCSIRKSRSLCRLGEPRNCPRATYERNTKVIPRLDDPQSFVPPSPTFSHLDYPESGGGSAKSSLAADFHPVAADPPRAAFDPLAQCHADVHAGLNGIHPALSRGNTVQSESPNTLRRSPFGSKTFCPIGGVSPGPSYKLDMGPPDIAGNPFPIGHYSHLSLASECPEKVPSKPRKSGKCSSPISVAESSIYPPSTASSGCRSITRFDCKGVYGQVYPAVALTSDVSLLAPSSLGLDHSPLSSAVSLPSSLEAALVKATPETKVVEERDITIRGEKLANRLSCTRTSPACPSSTAAPAVAFPPGSNQSRTGRFSPRSQMLAQSTFYLPPVHVKPVLRSTKSHGSGELRHKETADQSGMKRASTQERSHRKNLAKRQRSSPFGLCIASGGIEPLDGYDATPKANRTLVREFSSLSGTFLAATGSLRMLLRGRHEHGTAREGFTLGSAHGKSSTHEESTHVQRSTLPRNFKAKQAKPISISVPLPIPTSASASKVSTRLDEDKEWRESLLAQAVGYSFQGQTSLRRIPERASPSRQRPRIPSGLKFAPLAVNSKASLQISPNLTPSAAELEARRRAELEDDGGDLLPVDHEEVVCFGRAPTPLAHSLPPPKRTSSRQPHGSAASTLTRENTPGICQSSVKSDSAQSSIAEEVSVVNKLFLVARQTRQRGYSERGIPPLPPLPSSIPRSLDESNRFCAHQTHSPRRTKTSIPPPINIPTGKGNLQVLMTPAGSSSETLNSRHLPPSAAFAKGQPRTKLGSSASLGGDEHSVSSSRSLQRLPINGLLDATHPFYFPHSAPAEATTRSECMIRAWRHEIGSNEALLKLEDKISYHVENERERMMAIVRNSKLS